MNKGYVVLSSGKSYEGQFIGNTSHVGEVVFNTSHAGYEEMATDPSYFEQILVTTAPQQGNYGINNDFWESRKIWIRGFVCLEIQKNKYNQNWLDLLNKNDVPVVTDVDTRSLVMELRSSGTSLGALVAAKNKTEAFDKYQTLLANRKKLSEDWVYEVSRTSEETRMGQVPHGPKIAVLDLGCKENILRELLKRASEIKIFPARTPSKTIMSYKPDGILLSNGPGDPEKVEVVVDTVRQLLGQKYIFGICMGHQILARAVGGKTFKLKFGHRGGNHPIRDDLLKQIYVSSQNHGYAVDKLSLPKEVRVTHVNLNDNTVAGMASDTLNFMSVQYHPESHPGPNEASRLFDLFVGRLK